MMTALEQVQTLIPQMTLGEKAQLLRLLVGIPFPGIEKTPHVSGGEACVVRTRVPVWLLVQARRLGSSNTEILQAFPALRPSDLTNAWAYYEAHQTEIEQQIAENEMA